MTTKIQAFIAANVTAVFSFVSWLVTLPPEQQTGILGQFVAFCPAGWQPGVGFWTKILSSVSAVYMVYKAAHSGPQSPPANKPE